MKSKNATENKLKILIPQAFGPDRAVFYRELRRLGKRISRDSADPKALAALSRLEQRIQRSIRIRNDRSTRCPRVHVNPGLPIAESRVEIIEAIRRCPVVIVSGETGSGKTTQLPKLCLAAGRGLDGKIGYTQPRRIAATTVARRIAEELSEPVGTSVGYNPN